MTGADIEEVWSRLVAEPSLNVPYHYLQIVGGEMPVGAIVRASDKRPGLLIRFRSRDQHLIALPRPLRGLTFEALIPVGSESVGLPILLNDSSMQSVFAQLSADLVSAAADSASGQPTAIRVMRRLELWRLFLMQSGAPLSARRCQGLFAELHVLRLLGETHGLEAAAEAWYGWDRDLHDFRFGAEAIEVKSWRLGETAGIHITSLSQVVVDMGNPMLIVAVQISAGSQGETLPDAVSKLRREMGESARSRFDEKLAGAGYVEAHSDLYVDRYGVDRVDVFQVRDGFPHISPASVPGGVTNISYRIEIGALGPFRTITPHLASR